MRIRSRFMPILLAALVLWPVSLFAQKAAVDDLCRLHGMGEEENIRLIRQAYLAAVDAGISEDELLPFVEDILKHKLNCAQMVRVLAVTTKLREEKLPYFVVFSKVREGVVKEAPPILVVEAAEAKLKTLTSSRDVLKNLENTGYRIRDYQNAAVVVSSYLEKGYQPDELVSEIRKKGTKAGGFAALSGVVEKAVKK